MVRFSKLSFSPGQKLLNPGGQNWVPRLSLKTELFRRNRKELKIRERPVGYPDPNGYKRSLTLALTCVPWHEISCSLACNTICAQSHQTMHPGMMKALLWIYKNNRNILKNERSNLCTCDGKYNFEKTQQNWKWKFFKIFRNFETLLVEEAFDRRVHNFDLAALLNGTRLLKSNYFSER